MSEPPIDPPERPEAESASSETEPLSPPFAPPGTSEAHAPSPPEVGEAAASEPGHSPAPLQDDSTDSAADASGPPPREESPSAQDGNRDEPQVHRGKIRRVTSEDVLIELSDGRQGTVHIVEFAGQPLPKYDDDVSVIIEHEDSATGRITLSKRQADELDFWQSVGPGQVLEGVVTGMNKGGLDIDIGGARAFLPASQVDVRRMKDISILIGEHVQCVVSQVDRTTRDLVVSRKKYIEKQREQERNQAFDKIEVGSVVKGRVTSITDYGAFVDLGGVGGLLHLTDMTWGRIHHPKEAVEPGQELEVKVLKANRETHKISLGLKQMRPNPWDNIEERYPKDARVRGRVARTAEFGAFLELEEGVDALLPTSEMSWSRNPVKPEDVVTIGEEIEVAVLKVDARRQRISVGLKQTQENPWVRAAEQFPARTTVQGRVSRLADFGAFVEIAPGIEGLVHISELSDRRVKSVGDVVSEGQEVEVRVLKVDTEAQRVSLTMKPEHTHNPEEDKKASKRRKKPLRGGLASHFEW